MPVYRQPPAPFIGGRQPLDPGRKQQLAPPDPPFDSRGRAIYASLVASWRAGPPRAQHGPWWVVTEGLGLATVLFTLIRTRRR